MSYILIAIAFLLIISLFFDYQKSAMVESRRFETSERPSSSMVVSHTFEKILRADNQSWDKVVVSTLQFIFLAIFILISFYAWLTSPAYNAFFVSILSLFIVVLFPKLCRNYYALYVRKSFKREIPLLAFLLTLRGQAISKSGSLQSESLDSESVRNNRSRESYNDVLSDVKDALSVMSNKSPFYKAFNRKKEAFSGSEFLKFVRAFDKYSSFSSVQKLKKALYLWYRSGAQGKDELNNLVVNEHADILARESFKSFLCISFASLVLLSVSIYSMAFLIFL